MFGMANVWRRMIGLIVFGVGSIGVAGVGAALAAAPGHVWVQDQLEPGEKMSLNEWVATPHPVGSGPTWTQSSPKDWLRPELRQEFQFNDRT